jgi:hypothetical protein
MSATFSVPVICSPMRCSYSSVLAKLREEIEMPKGLYPPSKERPVVGRTRRANSP